MLTVVQKVLIFFCALSKLANNVAVLHNEVSNGKEKEDKHERKCRKESFYMTQNQLMYQQNKIKEAEAAIKRQEANLKAQQSLLDTSKHLWEYGHIQVPKTGIFGLENSRLRSKLGEDYRNDRGKNLFSLQSGYVPTQGFLKPINESWDTATRSLKNFVSALTGAMSI